MTFFKNASKNSCSESANNFATPVSCAKNTEESNMVNFCADTVMAVSVLFFVIICNALNNVGFLIISAIIISIIIKNNLWQSTALFSGQ